MCRNLTLYSNNSSGVQVQTCLGSCPVGTYLVSDRRECVPCHEYCSRGVGCVGPLPYLDLQNGCLECTLVQLYRNGRQVHKDNLYTSRLKFGKGGLQLTLY